MTIRLYKIIDSRQNRSMTDNHKKDEDFARETLSSDKTISETSAANLHLKTAWAIALLEAKLGLKPSISNAKTAKRHTSILALFSPGELKDAESGPTREELENKLAHLKASRTSDKMATFRKQLLKGVKATKTHEALRLIKRLKQARAESEGQVGDVADIEKELELTKSLNLETFTDQLVSHAICKTKPLAQHPHLQRFILEDQPSHCSVFSTAEGDELRCQKIVNRMTSFKILAQHVSKLKEDLLIHLGLKQPPKPSDKSDKRKRIDDEATKPRDPLPPKAESKPIRSKIKTSVFVSSLNGSEEDEQFKKLYGIKRNRPGQHARRELFERKYGSNANHLKLRKAQEAVKAKPKPKPKPKPAQNEKLHPSWEAKRRQKLSIDPSVIPKNNKIIFD